MITGARQGTLSGLRRLAAAAMARDLNAFLIPGPDIARAHGLDIEAAGLRMVASPRHANVLVVVGTIPPALREATAVIYAQMMRPRALFVLGTEALSPLPAADVATGLSQQDLIEGVQQLRRIFSESAFRPDVEDFDAPVLQVRIEYTCPMHPEVVQDEPGSCPKCGMNLIPREAQAGMAHTEHKKIDVDAEMQDPPAHEHHHVEHDAAVEYTCPMHPEVVQDKPGSCPECGMNLEPREAQPEPMHEHMHMAHDAPVEYTCPMHPEVVQNEPGSCPECGMNLEPREAQPEPMHEHMHMEHNAAVEYTCPMHPEVVQNEPGSCPECGMNLEPRDVQAEPTHEHMHMTQDAPVEYTCPMHPEVVQSEPGSCPKCGMNLEPRESQDTQNDEHAGMDHSAMDHSAMNHDDMSFMSMIDVTKDLPRSGDGLPMEWIEAPFGPFFPGLPGGLLLTLTLDGDTVAGSDVHSLTETMDLLDPSPMDATHFIERIASMDPLAPVAYRLLACQALENATGMDTSTNTLPAHIGALERERITSHLGWLSLFGQQTGFDWLMRRAASLQLKFQHADLKQIAIIKPSIQNIINRLKRTPLLNSRTKGIGQLASDTTLHGPVARASGVNNDARSMDKAFTALGFKPAGRKEGDAFARLQVRLDEITHSLALIEAAGVIELPAPNTIGEASGAGEASVETPRGMAHLQLTLEKGRVTDAQLETPSTPHLTLIALLIEQQELGDALTAVSSLDLSPWEVRQ